MSSPSGSDFVVADWNSEWLAADGLGGFAMGTVSGERTRRYHALFCPATTPPTGRMVLVNGFDAFIETDGGRFALTRQRYLPGVLSPFEGHLQSFGRGAFPQWHFVLPDRNEIALEIFSGVDEATVGVRIARRVGTGPARLTLRPFITGRDYHALMKERPDYRMTPEQRGESLVFRPLDGVPAFSLHSNGRWTDAPHWYRGFLYEEERARGLDFEEDCASPGELAFDLAAGDAVFIATLGEAPLKQPALVEATALRSARMSLHRSLEGPLERAADAYLVQRGEGRTVIAGYPWFTDWGRDTFIALRGLCLATGRFDDAKAIVLEWAGHVSEGMLPNRFPDAGEAPEFNSVDASLWYVIAGGELLEAVDERRTRLTKDERAQIEAAIDKILDGYAKGTRFRIHADDDGLIACGEPGVQLTWMDAKVDDWVVTPRIGKPVEIQALWVNALEVGAKRQSRFAALGDKARRSFAEKFWNEARGCLFDVVDVDHVRGRNDASVRPNQLFAAGGLRHALLDEDRCRRVVELCEATLLTPMGLRTLEPSDPAYVHRYEGDRRGRDGAYHQGTVWPWLMGPFVEAWVRVHGGTDKAKRRARERFLSPLLHDLRAAPGHIAEIADGDAPHTPRGCPFQAWSVGEALRLDRVVLAETPQKKTVRCG